MLTMFFFLIHPFMKFWKLSLMLIYLSFFMMKFVMNEFMSNMVLNLSLDLLSVLIFLLTLLIFSLSILSSKNIKNMNYFYLFMMIFLLKILYFLFSTFNMVIFYIFFEFSLIPMMLMILGWGMKVERLQAGIYFMFYTMFSSLPMLNYIILLYMYTFSDFMFFNSLNSVNKDFFFCFFFVFGFLVKMPIFMFHLWLPKAHVEAPVSASMILAGILLKLGGYGLLRIINIIMENLMKYSSFFISFSIWGGLMISMSCLSQLDMKMIVAFSSISHMSLLIGGFFTMNKLGMYGSFIIMIAHGLTSSGLFFLVNLFYERSFSRSLMINKGMTNTSSNLNLCSFLIISSSMASPPSINLLSEFLLFYSMIYYFSFFFIFLFLMLLLSVCYSMFMYSFIQHGKLFSGLFFFKKISIMEYMVLIMHWIFSNLLILKSEYFTLFLSF